MHMNHIRALTYRHCLLWMGISITLIGIVASISYNFKAMYWWDCPTPDSRILQKVVGEHLRANKLARYFNYTSAFGLLLILSGTMLTKRDRTLNENKTHAGPAYPPQGVGSPDP